MERSDLISGKRHPQYIDQFRILERIGPVAYRLDLSRDLEQIHDVFHVFMLRKYISESSHVLEATPVELNEDLSFEVQPMCIVDQKLKKLRKQGLFNGRNVMEKRYN